VRLTLQKNVMLRYIFFAKYDQFMPKLFPKMHVSYITVLDIAKYFIILSYSLHLKTAFCTVALMTVGLYTAAYLLLLAHSGTAGVKDKVGLTRRQLTIRHIVITMNVLTVRPTLLIGDSNI